MFEYFNITNFIISIPIIFFSSIGLIMIKEYYLQINKSQKKI